MFGWVLNMSLQISSNTSLIIFLYISYRLLYYYLSDNKFADVDDLLLIGANIAFALMNG